MNESNSFSESPTSKSMKPKAKLTAIQTDMRKPTQNSCLWHKDNDGLSLVWHQQTDNNFLPNIFLPVIINMSHDKQLQI